MHTLVVNAGGGLCNRINSLVNAIYFSQRLPCKIQLCWQPNNRCDCLFSDLFSSSLELFDEVTSEKPTLLIKPGAPRPETDSTPVLYVPHLEEVSTVASLLADTKEDIVQIANPLLFSGIEPEKAKEIVFGLGIRSRIQKQADDFIKENRIDGSVLGAHVRGTDFGHGKNKPIVNAIRELMRDDETKRCFVCSDELKLERQLKRQFPGNIILHDKGKAYVQRKGLNIFRSWHTDRLWRSGESIESALVDLLILAQTDLACFDPKSTFAQTALVLGDENAWARWETSCLARK